MPPDPGPGPRPARARRALAIVATAAVAALAACGSPPTGRIGTLAAQALPSFYRAPRVAGRRPGTLLRSEPVPAAGVVGTAQRLMYVALDAAGQPVAVTGLVYVPRRPAPAGGYPVVAWAHPTDGMGDPCAPSLDAATAMSHRFLNAMLTRGWEVVATDYQGEGTPPGIEPYLVGPVEAGDVLDAVTAARRLPGARSGRRTIVWGYSQGGQAAVFAWEAAAAAGRAGTDLLGVVAGAPPTDLPGLFGTLAPTPNRYLLLMAVAGFHVAYGSRAPLGAVLSAEGRRLLPELYVGCTDALARTIDAVPLSAVLRSDPATTPGWAPLLQADDPATFTATDPVPLLLVQGSTDTLVPPGDTATLARDLCRPGRSVTEWVVPGQGHVGALAASAAAVRTWIAGRFGIAGRLGTGASAAPRVAPGSLTGCTTTTVPGG